MVKEKLKELVVALDPEIQSLVTRVILLERDHLDMINPRGVVQTIRAEVEQAALQSLRREDGGA